jgi:CheY-like chemotaxis protein
VAGYLLLVEDDPELRMGLRDILEAEGITTLTAANGTQAIAIIASGGVPGAVITDLRMPRMDGRRLIHALRSRPETNAVPVLVMSAQAPARPLGDGVEWLGKPVPIDTLLGFARRHARPARGVSDPNSVTEKQSAAGGERTRREIDMIRLTLRSAMDRIGPESAEAFSLLSRSVALLDELAAEMPVSHSRLTSTSSVLSRAYAEIADIRRRRRERAALPAEQSVDDRGELAHAERLEEDNEVLAALQRGLALAKRIDRG